MAFKKGDALAGVEGNEMLIKGAETLRRLPSLVGMVAAWQKEILSSQRIQKYATTRSIVGMNMKMQCLGSFSSFIETSSTREYGLALCVLRQTICAQQNTRRDAPCRVKGLNSEKRERAKRRM